MATLTRPLEAWTWPAMGTTWRLYHGGGVSAEAAEAVTALVHADEQRWSRFLPHSELCALNSGAGSHVPVSPETIDVLRACAAWTRATDGLFQPLVGIAVQAWGYGRSMLEAEAGAAASPAGGPIDARIEIDPDRGTARIPDGRALDLGGIAKSWTVLRAGRLAAVLTDEPRLLVDGGGDLYAVRGDHLVDVAGGLWAEEPDLRIELHADEGVATSSTAKRRWRNADGVEAHHLIDPETGRPCPPAQATVCAPDPVTADVLATVLCLRPGMIGELALPSRVVTEAGERTGGGWEARCRR
ncbi:MAG TPA: FAD:protein FMN transferase [Gaiellales bacterium]|nr:FAD:protein FMN transferase [Gaiellales bacterium]